MEGYNIFGWSILVFFCGTIFGMLMGYHCCREVHHQSARDGSLVWLKDKWYRIVSIDNYALMVSAAEKWVHIKRTEDQFLKITEQQKNVQH